MLIEGKYSILIISPQPWGKNFISKHHYAQELSHLGHKVYFLDPPADDQIQNQVSDNVHLIKYCPKYRGLNRLPSWLRRIMIKREIKNLYRLINNPIDIVWSFDPYRFQELDLFGAKLTIFHMVDLIDSSLDIKTARNADLILTTNELILNRYQALPNLKLNIGHGLAQNFLNLEDCTAYKLRQENRIAIGYSGNLLIKYLDRHTLKQMILTHTNADFYFCGPYQSSNLLEDVHEEHLSFVEFLKSQSNCFLLGPQDQGSLQMILCEMDILLLCYNTRLYKDQVANPHKVLEYLSTGKVVVSNYMQAYHQKEHLIEMADTNEVLNNLLIRVMSNLPKYNSTALKKARIQHAQNHSYQQIIRSIDQFLSNRMVI